MHPRTALLEEGRKMTLLELLGMLRRHLKLVILLPILCALAMGAYSYFLMPNTYTSSVSMYVLARSGEESGGPTNAEFTASQMLTNDVAKLVESGRVMSDTAYYLSLDSLDQFQIDVASDTNTRVITISVTSTSPESTAVVADALASTTGSVAQEVMDVQSISILNQAETPQEPSGPNRIMYTAVAFLAGLFAAVAIVVLQDMLNTCMRSPEELEDLLGIPTIGRIPTIKG